LTAIKFLSQAARERSTELRRQARSATRILFIRYLVGKFSGRRLKPAATKAKLFLRTTIVGNRFALIQ
jgi:hypothetical protein